METHGLVLMDGRLPHDGMDAPQKSHADHQECWPPDRRASHSKGSNSGGICGEGRGLAQISPAGGGRVRESHHSVAGKAWKSPQGRTR